MKTEITEITIKLGDREIKLSPADARHLRDALNELLGNTYYPVYTSPIIMPTPPAWPNHWQVTCHSGFGSGGESIQSANLCITV